MKHADFLASLSREKILAAKVSKSEENRSEVLARLARIEREKKEARIKARFSFTLKEHLVESKPIQVSPLTSLLPPKRKLAGEKGPAGNPPGTSKRHNPALKAARRAQKEAQAKAKASKKQGGGGKKHSKK